MESADKTLNIVFGQVLKNLRNEIGISQQDLAFNCQLDRTYISLLERGLRQPTIKTLFTLANNLNIKASKFIEIVEDAFY